MTLLSNSFWTTTPILTLQNSPGRVTTEDTAMHNMVLCQMSIQVPGDYSGDEHPTVVLWKGITAEAIRAKAAEHYEGWAIKFGEPRYVQS